MNLWDSLANGCSRNNQIIYIRHFIQGADVHRILVIKMTTYKFNKIALRSLSLSLLIVMIDKIEI